MEERCPQVLGLRVHGHLPLDQRLAERVLRECCSWTSSNVHAVPEQWCGFDLGSMAADSLNPWPQGSWPGSMLAAGPVSMFRDNFAEMHTLSKPSLERSKDSLVLRRVFVLLTHTNTYLIAICIKL
jgi:hypothetical protein